MQTVLAGVEVAQHKTRLVSGQAEQQGGLVVFAGQGHSHPALGLGGLGTGAGGLTGEQQRAPGKGQQHQQPGPEGGPKGSPSTGMHGKKPPFKMRMHKAWAGAASFMQKEGCLV